MLRGVRTVIVVGVVLIGIAALIRYVTTQPTTKESTTNAPVEIATVDRGDVAITVNATGNIQPKQNVSLAFASSGKVTAINVKEGDYVLKGQTIATVDDQSAQDAVTNAQIKVNAQKLALNKLLEKPSPEDITVAQDQVKVAEANLAESKIGPTDSIQIEMAQINVEIAKNQLWQAELNRDIANQRKKNITPGTVPTDNQNGKAIASADAGVTVAQDQLKAAQSHGPNAGSIQSAQASLTQAQIQLQTLLAGPNANDLKQAQANLDAAQSALDQARQDLAKTRLIAPFDGLVAQLNLSLGQAAPSTQAVILLDVSSFYVDLPIAELDIARVKADQPVNLRFDALPGSVLNGKVTKISDVANTGSPVTYTVRVEFDPAGQPLLSTMSTTAAVVTSNASNVVRLPNRFIRLDQQANKAYATVRQPDGTFKEEEIQLGVASDTYTEIKSGLNAGNVVTMPQAGRTGGGFGGGGFPLRGLGG